MHPRALLFFTWLLLSSTKAIPGNGNGNGGGNGNNGNGGGEGNGNHGPSDVATGVANGKFRFAHPTKKRTDKENCFIVKLRDEATSDKKHTLFNQTEGTDGEVFGHSLHGFIKCGCQLSQLKQLAEDDDIELIEEDAQIYVDAVQTTGSYWHLDRIDQSNLPLNGAFNYQYTGQGTIIYILDSGVNGAHQEFTGRMGTGVDIIGGGTVDPNTDCLGHGSHCAGLAGGTLAGVAKLATIISVRVLGCDGGGTSSSVISGISWVMTQPRGVMSLSLGCGTSSTMNTAVANAVAADYIVVAAAGNSACDACTQSPASAPEAITVASVGSTDTQSSWSNYGSCVDVYAPGENLLSASNTDTTSYVYKSGTSMACPVVAGVAAAYLSGNPSLSAADMQQVIINEATYGVVQGATTGTPNRLVKSSGFPSLKSRSPSNSPLSQSPSPSPVSASPSPGTPSNTLCSNAIYLPCGTTVAGSTINAVYTPTPVTCTTTHTAPEVWYSIYVPASGSVTASLCGGATWDTKLTMWSGTCTATNLTGLSCVIGNDDSCSLQSSLTTTVNAGWYYLMVHGYKSIVGKFNLTLTCPAVPSPSRSPSATASPSRSPSVSSSPIPSPDPSPSPNSLPVPSPTASPSLSPKTSPSPSRKPSPSPSRKPSPSRSPSTSPSTSLTASPSPSPIVSDSPSPIVSDSPSPLVSDSPSPIVSDSPSPVASPSPDVSPSPSTAPSPSGTTRSVTDGTTTGDTTHASDTGLRAVVYGLIAGMCVLFGFIVGVGLMVGLVWYCVWPKLAASGLLSFRSDSSDSNSDSLASPEKMTGDDSEVAQKETLLNREETVNLCSALFQGPNNNKTQSVSHLPPTQSMTSWKGPRTNSMYDNV